MKNPTKREFQRKFDSIATTYELVSNPYTIKRRAESLYTDSIKTVLEVGSGTGIATESMSGIIVCSDISIEMCRQAKRKREMVICCDAEKLPFKSDTFDGIISSEMIYYLNNPENFISNSYTILKKNGRLLISMANQDMTIVSKIRSLLRGIGIGRTYFDDGVNEFMKIKHLKFLLNKYNFKINSIEKKVIFPFASFDGLNRILEKTLLDRFCLFIIIKATKT